ncbi:MBL fold metallo-hydrolase [Rhodoferax sp.]|uniref:MBL fold metallo-hydrolase n=1 Tax=Rhodoferax sp. TaxID=50421 RepID=UPI00260A10C3|nr:MBL fold metallo-hydrolase [Rhodoferax sp.]MDD2917602.1 MBL fold metallo-hydrolase [Rhodoferax sp.]
MLSRASVFKSAVPWLQIFLAALLWASATVAQAAEPIFKTVKVTERVYALVGELTQRSPANLGNNMTSGFVIADDGVVVVDSGGSAEGAKLIRQAVRAVTDKPVRWVVNSGGQDHRWFGNDYFQRVVGARVIASEPGVLDMKARGLQQYEAAKVNLGEKVAGTVLAYPDVTFSKRHKLAVNGVDIELIESGGAHTRADIFVWLPKEKLVFTGDVVFVDRLLGIQPGMGLLWIAALSYLRDELRPVTVIPGHGGVATLGKAMKDSLGYLTLLRDGAAQAFKDGAFDPVEASQAIDQTPFSYLVNFTDARFRSNNAIRMAEEVFAGIR